MKENDIFDAVDASEVFRIVNLAATQTSDDHPQDKLAVEHFVKNRPYGCCIDRGSKITIVSPSSLVDPCSGYFAYYLALIGGFNYISREVAERVIGENPDAQVVWLENSGHMGFIEQEDETAQALIDFIKNTK